MTAAECHPDRTHHAKGMCRPCCNAQYYREHREVRLEYNRQWHERNPEYSAQYSRQWREEHPEWAAQYNAQYRQKHHAECLERTRKWRAENSDKRANYKSRRRALKRESPAIPFTPGPIDGEICFYCGAPAEQWDHFIPLSRSGGHLPGNLVPACAGCNGSKGARLPENVLTQLSLGGVYEP